MFLSRYSEKIKLVYYVAVIKKDKIPLASKLCVLCIHYSYSNHVIIGGEQHKGGVDSGQIANDYTSYVQKELKFSSSREASD